MYIIYYNNYKIPDTLYQMQLIKKANFTKGSDKILLLCILLYQINNAIF